MKTAWKCLGLGLGLWAVAAGGQETKEPLVLRVFDQLYAASELGLPANVSAGPQLAPLIKGVVGPLLADELAKKGISVGEEDLKEYCRRQMPAGADFKESWAEWQPNGLQWKARQEAVVQLTAWKLHQALFAEYGGRVIPGGRIPPQAFDALIAHVAAREAAGDFSILDARLRLRFWECLRTPPARLVPEEEGRALMAEHPADRLKRLPAP